MLKLIDHIGDATVYQILEYLGVEQRDFDQHELKKPYSRNSIASRVVQVIKLN
jgi:hypothetical protein